MGSKIFFIRYFKRGKSCIFYEVNSKFLQHQKNNLANNNYKCRFVTTKSILARFIMLKNIFYPAFPINLVLHCKACRNLEAYHYQIKYCSQPSYDIPKQAGLHLTCGQDRLNLTLACNKDIFQSYY